MDVKVYHADWDMRSHNDAHMEMMELVRSMLSNQDQRLIAADTLFNAGHYDQVAHIESDWSQEDYFEQRVHAEVFRLTNHINKPWWENEGVTLVKESRSTSIGDIIMIGNRRFMAHNVSWIALDPVVVEAPSAQIGYYKGYEGEILYEKGAAK